MAVSQLIGAPVRRREDPELITGTGSYVDDLPSTGVLHMYVVRSPHGHARIQGIETARVREADGVVAVLTGAATWANRWPSCWPAAEPRQKMPPNVSTCAMSRCPR